MTYQTEFPDYDPSTMPAIPAHWLDSSWVNEPCPSFEVNGLRVFVDYADASSREFPETERFSVHDMRLENSVLHYGDDWAALLAFVANRETLGRRYVELIGYDPFEDDPAISATEVARTIAEYETAYLLPTLLPAETGRYSVYAQDEAGSFSGHTDDADGAAEILAREFRASRWTNRFATAAIYDGQAMRYVWAWHAGDRHIVRDTRHPLEVIFTKALKSGRDVVLIG